MRHDLDAIRHEPWALRPEVAPVVAAALAGRISAEEIRAQGEWAKAQAQEAQTSGGLAVIPLHGLITPRASLLSLLFGGGGGLEAFRGALREAVASPDVGRIVIDVDSPGGLADLVTETAAEIRAAREVKPITAVANTDAFSAAYWIASQADELVVTPSGAVGSVGVFVLHEDISKADEEAGITTTIISAGKYKAEGNPYEPLTREARVAIQRDVDEIYGMFVADVAAGRGVGEGKVGAGFGEGRIVLARQALEEGMVDGVATFEATLARLGAEPEPEEPDQPEPDESDEDDDEARAETSPPSGGGEDEQRAEVADLLLP